MTRCEEDVCSCFWEGARARQGILLPGRLYIYMPLRHSFSFSWFYTNVVECGTEGLVPSADKASILHRITSLYHYTEDPIDKFENNKNSSLDCRGNSFFDTNGSWIGAASWKSDGDRVAL